jgi:hypothetical protein
MLFHRRYLTFRPAENAFSSTCKAELLELGSRLIGMVNLCNLYAAGSGDHLSFRPMPHFSLKTLTKTPAQIAVWGKLCQQAKLYMSRIAAKSY